jgi:1-acyl-sn-glycerol-3-phosphate acyltransferase
MVDSAYLHWSLESMGGYLRHFDRFSWNVPAIEHFISNPFLRAIVYLGKCVPINRGGDDVHRKAVMEKLKWLVQQGEVVTLFPEGSRSRTGRIDPSTVTYGIGQLLTGLERPQVLCAYLRGRHQERESGVPPWGDTLDLSVELLEPATTQTGLRAWRDLSKQVIEKLKSLEDAWFTQRGTNALT